MNNKLISEMSHDLRTPLASIMLYLEILKTHRYSDQTELDEYLNKIYKKVTQMKNISDNLFDYSLNKTTKYYGITQSMHQAFGNHIKDFCDNLKIHGYSVVYDNVIYPFSVNVNPEHLQRIFDNIFSNIKKYAEPCPKVEIETLDRDNYCGFSVMNKCSATSCPHESHGIGNRSMSTMMDQMNGLCSVKQTEDVFKIDLLFPKM